MHMHMHMHTQTQIHWQVQGLLPLVNRRLSWVLDGQFSVQWLQYCANNACLGFQAVPSMVLDSVLFSDARISIPICCRGLVSVFSVVLI
jgi:hypothetical protein